MKYTSSDLAVIIPTKDRPKQVERHLQSLVEQNCQLGRIIIVASGVDIKNVVMNYKNKLPVEYHRSEPGQVRQRNVGIALLDKSTKLVASMDDDVTYHRGAITRMINFWNSIEPGTAGVGFNIVNLSSTKHNWFRGVIGFSTPKPGQVLKSGFNTSISNVDRNIPVQWLNGGATVWRQDVLFNNPHKELNMKWAVGEDLIFSYPLGKQYSLFICAEAEVEIEEVILDSQPKEFYINRGKSIFLMGLYFILHNKDLSLPRFMINKFLYLTALFVKGTVFLDINKYYVAIGIITSLMHNIPVLVGLKSYDSLNIGFSDSEFV